MYLWSPKPGPFLGRLWDFGDRPQLEDWKPAFSPLIHFHAAMAGTACESSVPATLQFAEPCPRRFAVSLEQGSPATDRAKLLKISRFFAERGLEFALRKPRQQGEILSVDRCFASEGGVLLNYRMV